MSEPSDPEPGDRPAPEPLRLVQDFVNTRDLEGGEDELGDPAAARAWLRRHSLVGRGSLTAADHARLLEVRESLRSLLAGHNGLPVPEAEVAALNRATARATLQVRFDGSGQPVLTPAASGVDQAVAVILGRVVAAMAEGTWERLKACHDEVCQWAFYDHSRNRSGTWCSMAVCGNRAKMRSFRERSRES
jgi:predicted RNA-binding Zn ribbon-like protein